jgi:hypothetical protein
MLQFLTDERTNAVTKHMHEVKTRFALKSRQKIKLMISKWGALNVLVRIA